MNGTGQIISVKKVADRRSERDSGTSGMDVSDDDLIVEDGGTKGEYNQRQQRYECTSQDIRDKLGILWRFKANRNTCSSMPIKSRRCCPGLYLRKGRKNSHNLVRRRRCGRQVYRTEIFLTSFQTVPGVDQANTRGNRSRGKAGLMQRCARRCVVPSGMWRIMLQASSRSSFALAKIPLEST